MAGNRARLVRRRGPLREEHGDVLRAARAEEEPRHLPGGDGYVEAVSQRDQRTRPAGGNPVRQVPHHASLGQGARRGAQIRVPANQRPDRSYINGQKYTLLSRRENLSLDGRKALKKLLAANNRLNRAYSFGQLSDYEREGWARRFFDHWRASLKWQRLEPYETFAATIERDWDGIAACCKPENKVSLGFVAGLNNMIRVIQRRAYGRRDEECLRLKILIRMLPEL